MILTYARAGVAVLLGAILAVTNIESAQAPEQVKQRSAQPKRRLGMLDKLLDKVAPIEPVQSEPIEPQIEPQNLAIEPHPLKLVNTQKNGSSNKKQLVYDVLSQNHQTTVTELVQTTGVTKGYASMMRKQFLEEQENNAAG